MKKMDEKVLLCNFHDEGTIGKIQMICMKMNVGFQIVPDHSWNQKIGFLLGQRGFTAAANNETDDFTFSDEVLMLSNLKNRRLDQFLLSLKNDGVPPILYKATVTPFNILWTLRRLCETIHREHKTIIEWEKSNGKS